uniref:BABA1 protein n=1 Tax=Junco hyemalis TaxID=40217 RepID=A0A8C5IQN3_JUNHY
SASPPRPCTRPAPPAAPGSPPVAAPASCGPGGSGDSGLGIWGGLGVRGVLTPAAAAAAPPAPGRAPPRLCPPPTQIICLDLAEEMAVPKLESFNGSQKVELPVTDNVQTIPPPFVVRTILVFGRPRCQPHFYHYMRNLTPLCPRVSPPQDMFGFFGSLDTKGTNYKYEVALAGPALELHNCMAKLLAHPLQRPCQSHAHYGLLDGGDSPEGEAAS